MEKIPLVSIVIPTYNSKDFIEKCLETIFKTDYLNYEVIIVDDMSTDTTVSLIQEKFGTHKNMSIFINTEKKLAAGSRNICFSHSKGEFVALLDHDVEVHPLWVKEMVLTMEKDKNIGIVQGKIFDINRRDILQCVGVRIIPQVGWVDSIGFGEKDTGKYDNLDTIVGAATGVLYRKSAFDIVGGFDEELGINTDDLDLNWRFWIAGFTTKVSPGAIIYHWSKKQKLRDKWINRHSWEFHYAKFPRIFIKNYSLINVLKYLPIYLFVALARGVFNAVFRRNPATLTGLVASLWWNMKLLPDTLKERKRIQGSFRKLSDNQLKSKIFINKSLFIIFKNTWLPFVKSGEQMATNTIESI
jgi:GT2 family glycosyltransferase